MPSDFDSDEQRPGTSRRSFLRTSGGVATGIAVTVLPSGVVALAAPAAAHAKDEPAATRVDAAGELPEDPVMAYLHDAKRAIVTVVSGTTEKTYHDPALAQRLLDAAHA
jgi:hypothetical protein